jgi:transcriptional regulator with XRE-family HTH domain
MLQAMTQHPSLQIKQRVGANLAAARVAKGMTQRQVGEAVGAAGPDVSRWENGRVEPGPAYRQALADVLFDGDVSALYREPEEIAA